MIYRPTTASAHTAPPRSLSSSETARPSRDARTVDAAHAGRSCGARNERSNCFAPGVVRRQRKRPEAARPRLANRVRRQLHRRCSNGARTARDCPSTNGSDWSGMRRAGACVRHAPSTVRVRRAPPATAPDEQGAPMSDAFYGPMTTIRITLKLVDDRSCQGCHLRDGMYCTAFRTVQGFPRELRGMVDLGREYGLRPKRLKRCVTATEEAVGRTAKPVCKPRARRKETP